MTGPPAATAEALLQALPPEDASLARSLLSRVRALGTVTERLGRAEISLIAVAGNAELARLLVRPGASPRLLIEGREPLEIASLTAASNAADEVRALAAAAAARAPQLDLFGKR